MKVIFVDATSSKHMASEDFTMDVITIPKIDEDLEFERDILSTKLLNRLVDDYVTEPVLVPKVLSAKVLKVTHVYSRNDPHIRIDLDMKFNYK